MTASFQQQCSAAFQCLNQNKNCPYAEDEVEIGTFTFQFRICLSFPNVPQVSALSKTSHSVQVLGFSLRGAFLAPQAEVFTIANKLPAI